MFGTRRLAKRSIIGTKVCAPWTDGRYYPGVIQSIQSWPNGEEAYTVNFDDGYTRTFTDRELIGPGFQSISIATLKFGQKVFLTHNGRELSGQVTKHDRDADEVLINVKAQNGPFVEEIQISRRLEEVRLVESRKSARLQDQDTDYSRLADIHQQDSAKKRAVSHVIDVPSPATKQRRPRKNSSPDPEGENGRKTDMDTPPEDMEDDDNDDGDSESVMMAAMALTSLSCSPVSPGGYGNLGNNSPLPGSSIGSSGVWSSNPSPSQHAALSHSAPVPTVFGNSGTVDEGIELDDTVAYFSEESGPKKRRASTRTVFKCTWPGCSKIHNTVSAIEKHVRDQHLGPKQTPEDSDLSDDHEEEFYYQETEVSVETVTQTFAEMYTSSPPHRHFMEAARPLPDHDYQKKDHRSAPLNIPLSPERGSHPHGASYPSTQPMAAPQMSRSSSWQIPSQSHPCARVTKAQERLQQHQAQSPKNHFLSSSPKSSPMHKKSRSEIKKCRKVYGMENRDLWCTQCKWKKACSRFMD